MEPATGAGVATQDLKDINLSEFQIPHEHYWSTPSDDDCRVWGIEQEGDIFYLKTTHNVIGEDGQLMVKERRLDHWTFIAEYPDWQKGSLRHADAPTSTPATDSSSPSVAVVPVAGMTPRVGRTVVDSVDVGPQMTATPISTWTPTPVSTPTAPSPPLAEDQLSVAEIQDLRREVLENVRVAKENSDQMWLLAATAQPLSGRAKDLVDQVRCEAMPALFFQTYARADAIQAGMDARTAWDGSAADSYRSSASELLAETELDLKNTRSQFYKWFAKEFGVPLGGTLKLAKNVKVYGTEYLGHNESEGAVFVGGPVHVVGRRGIQKNGPLPLKMDNGQLLTFYVEGWDDAHAFVRIREEDALHQLFNWQTIVAQAPEPTEGGAPPIFAWVLGSPGVAEAIGPVAAVVAVIKGAGAIATAVGGLTVAQVSVAIVGFMLIVKLDAWS